MKEWHYEETLMTIINFTPTPAFIGGVLIGLAAAILLFFNGRIFGITGVISGIITPKRRDIFWRVILVVGLTGGALLAHKLFNTGTEQVTTRPIPLLILGGFITGLGARIGSGCTSGHGVCGISRFSKRSILATLTFMATGILTVLVVRLLGH